jgi:hypothetical protein
MISVIYPLTQPLIRKLESIDYRIDEVADVERHADRINRIPNADEVNSGLLGVAKSNFEFLGRGIAGFAPQ